MSDSTCYVTEKLSFYPTASFQHLLHTCDLGSFDGIERRREQKKVGRGIENWTTVSGEWRARVRIRA